MLSPNMMMRSYANAALAWAMVFGLGEQRVMSSVSRRSLIFLALSGLATGISWLAYFRALQMAHAERYYWPT